MRAKAIEIANALLEEGYEEGRAIRIAIAQAKRWAERSSPEGCAPGSPGLLLSLYGWIRIATQAGRVLNRRPATRSCPNCLASSA